MRRCICQFWVPEQRHTESIPQVVASILLLRFREYTVFLTAEATAHKRWLRPTVCAQSRMGKPAVVYL